MKATIPSYNILALSPEPKLSSGKRSHFQHEICIVATNHKKSMCTKSQFLSLEK